MIVRRDILRLISASAVASHLPFAINAREAEAVLNEPITFDVPLDPAPSVDGHGWPLSSATEFANNVRRSLYAEDWGGFGDGAPEEWAAYKKALGTVIDLAPEILERPGPSPVSRLDESVVALAGTSWEAGVRVGAQLEMLRQSLMNARQICTVCNGYGRRTTFTPDGERVVQPCSRCDGVGTVNTVAV